MTTLKVTATFVKCNEQSPDKDGCYSTFDTQLPERGLSTCLYTVEGGWNTRYDINGKLRTETRLNFEERDYMYWAQEITVTEETDEEVGQD